MDLIVIEPIHLNRWIGVGSEMDFHKKSNTTYRTIALEEGENGEMYSEGRLSQGSNLSPIPIEADKLLYP